ncbi:unnamed protein product [Phytophthora fragariaefolia]|uniref:Unnamed protein product n=1 Tax=Phytophthora fragariaefolia TaxID=1490495 RepID=A0A9W6XU18_9STRA|nr:unnamed protein product [Phytophthora fragariaefolia]
MQPWSAPENTIVLTDLLRPSQSQLQQQHLQQHVVYVKTEPEFVAARPRLVELPPLLPPRAAMLPAISDVLRSASPQHQQHQFQNQENVRAANRPSFTPSGVGEPATFSAWFMSTCSFGSPQTFRMSRVASAAVLKDARAAPNTMVAAGSTASGCSNRAKSRGYCWSHGGGTKCKTGDCDKIAISNGLCWAHGGGKSLLEELVVPEKLDSWSDEWHDVFPQASVASCRAAASRRTSGPVTTATATSSSTRRPHSSWCSTAWAREHGCRAELFIRSKCYVYLPRTAAMASPGSPCGN